jgi:hypothetical protein
VEQKARGLGSDVQDRGDLGVGVTAGEEAQCGEFVVGEVRFPGRQDGPVDVPVFGLDAVAGGAQAGGEFFGDDHGPVQAAAAQDMDVRTPVVVVQGQEREGAVETAFDEPEGAGSGEDVVPYEGVEAGGAQHPFPDGGGGRGVAQGAGVDEEGVAAGSVVVADAVAGDDGLDEGRGVLGR